MKKHGLLQTFGGEYIEVITDLKVTQSVQSGEHGEPIGIEVPMIIAGFLMDADAHFIYLSPDGEEVNEAIPLTSIKHLAIIAPGQEKTIFDSILEEMPEPEDDKGYN